jgi:hypothetical protein
VVVEATFGTGLGVAAIPHAHVHGIDWRMAPPSVAQRMAGEQVPQRLLVDLSSAERGVEATPAAPVDGGQALR